MEKLKKALQKCVTLTHLHTFAALFNKTTEKDGRFKPASMQMCY